MKEDIKYQKFKKILKYAILFVLGCIMIYSCSISEVYAESITTGAPKYTITENNGNITTSTSVLIDFWGTDYWRGSPNFGVVSSDVSIDTQEFYYTNSNWCVGKNLNVSGYVVGIYDFYANGGSIQVFNNNKAMTCTFARENSSRVKYSCIGEGGGTFKIVMYRNNAPLSYDTGISRTIELSCDDTLSNVIENDKENTNAIIDNQNQSTQDIIDNQDKNNEELKEELKENFNSCRPSKNLFPGWIIGTGINNTTGAITTNSNYASSSDYIKVDFNTNSNYYLSGLSSDLRSFVAAYNSNKEFLGRTGANYTNSISLKSTSFPNGTSQGTGEIAFIRITSYVSGDTTGSISQVNNLKTMLNIGSSSQSYEPYGEEVCTNKIDETNDKLDNLTGAITDSSSPDTSGLSDAAGWLPPGPVDSLLTLPINLLNSLLGNLESTCNPINLTLPFVNNSFVIPCPIEILNNFGDNFMTFFNWFGAIAGCWCLYKYFINLYKWVEIHLSMDEKESLGKWGGV